MPNDSEPKPSPKKKAPSKGTKGAKGAKKKPSKKKGKKRHLSAVETLGLLFFLGLGVFFISMCSANSDEEPERSQEQKGIDEQIGVWTMCQQFVKERLKSPGTADFGGLLDGNYQDPKETVKVLGKKSYTCTGWVDSQNSFGAIMRTKFKLTVKEKAGDKWELVSMDRFE